MHILWWAIIGVIAGFLTGKIMSGRGYGILHDMFLGLIGAIIGGLAMRLLGLAESDGLIYTVVIAILGAMLVTFAVRMIRQAA